MLARLRAHLTYANVASSIALFIALAGGTAWAVDEWTGANIQDGTLTTLDYKNNNIGSADVRNLNLNDEDVAQGTFVNFSATIGQVVSGVCKLDPITGINAQGDHLLLTPNTNDDNPYLDYTIEYSSTLESAMLRTCNYSDTTQNDGTTHFNLLVIDAQ